MRTRSVIATLVTLFAGGCVTNDAPAEDRPATATQDLLDFHCLNHTSIHVVTCSGSISLFPITITIDSLRVLSDNEVSLLNDDLNDVSVLDGSIVDHNEILDDVEARVADTFLDEFHVVVTAAEIAVCTVVAGTQICR
ncbi:MAG TPA: hypothetical protein VLM79_37180 [Kofleriaceae bacterium]|nr:hypothetical protein [Kofleriaceae bacterium]